MPPHGDISMRHFPDLSDTSFRIPLVEHDDILTENRPADIGLDFDAFAEDDPDGDPFTTPMPKSKKHAPLTLSDITPRGERTSSQPESSTNVRRENGKEVSRQEEIQPPVRPVPPKKESVDDMFARRKRDSYQQMGIDLTSKSTARLRNATKGVTQDHVKTNGGTRQREATKVVAGHTTGVYAKEGNNVKAKRPVLGKDAGISKQRPRAAPTGATTQTAKPKSILKPSKAAAALPPSTLSRTLTTLSHTPKADRPKWGNVVAEVQHTSHGRESTGSGIGIVGGGLIDVLVMYGEKLKGSLGFSSSAGKSSTPQASSSKEKGGFHLPLNLTENSNHKVAGPSSKPLTLSDLSPPKSNTDNRPRKDVLTLSDLSPSKALAADEDFVAEKSHEPRRSRCSPMRPATKRTSSGPTDREAKKGRAESECESDVGTSPKKPAEVARAQPRVKAISKPKPLGPSHTMNSTHKTATKHPRQSPKSVSSRDLKGKSKEMSGATTHNRRAANKEQRAPPGLTVPSGPASASDLYRQRALDKIQKGREKQAEKEAEKRTFKASTMPYFNKPAPPARPAVRPTIPVAFSFQSDARATQRNAEFEEKRKTWESRTAHTHQAMPMPNFAAIHAAHDAAARRHVVPVLPTEAPQLTTIARAREREKFEEERRERERALEKLREEREQERAKQEERAYRDARKRTVPKAHEVPEWYKDVPKRKEVE